ncbi:MAG: pyridoxal-phosphate dependent enzyme [Bacteroidia bacterium]|nr:pyridoxal-phosphate dependent enzyme [Bacteroidia bacterium]
MKLPVFEDIIDAHKLIKEFIHRTPILTSSAINRIIGSEIFFKCENLQKTGAFKFRGACNAVFSLTNEQASRGVGTHSSGNHAAALALAARIRGIQAHIVMPSNSPEIKKKAVAGYGGIITYCEPTLQSRETTLREIAEKTGIEIVHPYNNCKVIAGQGTAAKELLEEIPILDLILCPVGGGGLLSGTALSVKAISPLSRVIAAEPSGADDAYRSFKAGYIIPSVKPKTIADGLLTSLGEINFAVISQKVDDILTVSEESIIEAMRLVWERMKLVIEPSSAVPLAALLEKKEAFRNLRIGIILSGGNIDLGNLPF